MDINQKQAAEMFGARTAVFYVCDGGKGCAAPDCLDHSRNDVCHHTADVEHALYGEHDIASFSCYPSIRGGEPVVILVEPCRG